MKVVVQRVSSARVEVAGEMAGAIGKGLLVLAGIATGDSEADLAWTAGKLAKLRIFADAAGVMNLSVNDVGGEILAISQFTLLASVSRGNRPSWSQAASPEIARPLFERFVGHLQDAVGHKVQTGVFGADMRVQLANEGPVTILIDSRRP
ncbi:MAG: D-aminoacyl-tRNA deacylase [Propionivibrio sp.]